MSGDGCKDYTSCTPLDTHNFLRVCVSIRLMFATSSLQWHLRLISYKNTPFRHLHISCRVWHNCHMSYIHNKTHSTSTQHHQDALDPPRTVGLSDRLTEQSPLTVPFPPSCSLTSPRNLHNFEHFEHNLIQQTMKSPLTRNPQTHSSSPLTRNPQTRSVRLTDCQNSLHSQNERNVRNCARG